MITSRTHHLALGLIAGIALSSAAQAGDYSSSSAYNSGYGMAAGQENRAADFSLRDENGNMTILNGRFSSASNQHESGVQQATAQSGTGAGSSSGMSGAGRMTGGAQAIGNSLNVVTNGNFNTVIVNSTQTNNGNQTASVVLNTGQ